MELEEVSMSRVTQTTPNQEWMTAADNRLGQWLDTMSRLPVILDAQRGALDPEMSRRFLLQIGKGVIEAFPEWLNNMLVRADEHHQVQLFLRANRREKSDHWLWWKYMAAHFNLNELDFKHARITDPCVAELNQWLTTASREFPLAFAMSALHFVIETGAARLAALVAPAMRRKLSARQSQWIEAHTSWDPDHSVGREIIKSILATDPEGQKKFVRSITFTASRFTNALDSAYDDTHV